MENKILLKESNSIVEEILLSPSGKQQICPGSLVKICIVLSGNGAYHVFGKEIPCKGGDVYVVNSDVGHGYFVSSKEAPLTIRRILFDPLDWFEGDTVKNGSPDFCYGVFRDNLFTACATLNSEMRSETERLCSLIQSELENRPDQWHDAIRAHLSLLLINVSRYINEAIKSVPNAPQKDWSTFTSAIALINDNLEDSDLTLEAVANRLLTSASRLSRLFKSMTVGSFSEYIKEARICQAQRLLSYTDLTVEKIVEQCGLKDVPSFYKAFAAHTGMTPNVYRNQQKNKFTDKSKGNVFMIILSEISAQLQAGKAKIVKEMVQQAIDEGIPAETILKEGLVPGMNVIGEKFKNNEVFVPEVLVAARAMNQGAALLKPLLVQEGVPAAGKVCIGTVHGDLHDIGKNIVKMMLEGKGFEVVDLGTDVPAEAFVNAAIEQKCDIICCSALLTTTMGVMAEVVKKAEEAGIRDKVKIMVGGAPLSQEFCDQIGADAYTSDAASCADLALELCK